MAALGFSWVGPSLAPPWEGFVGARLGRHRGQHGGGLTGFVIGSLVQPASQLYLCGLSQSHPQIPMGMTPSMERLSATSQVPVFLGSALGWGRYTCLHACPPCLCTPWYPLTGGHACLAGVVFS